MLSLLNPKDINILVIGDIMLDVYNYGDANRISPEAPVPVFHSKEKKYYLGGAANTYANLCNIGVNAHLFGVIGDDSNGEILKDLIYKVNIFSSNHLINKYSRPTITKERIVAKSQQIVRVDTEEIENLNNIQISLFLNAFDNLMHSKGGLDAIIISDYGKGMICESFMEALRFDPLFFNTDVFIDPYPKHKEMYALAYCITPNIKEFEDMGGDINYFLNTLKVNKIVKTEGEHGMTVFENEGNYHIKTEAQTVYDVSGAGDTVIATIAAAKSMGFTFQDSVILANRAAGHVVSEMGTTAVNPEFMKKIIREASYASNYAKSS